MNRRSIVLSFDDESDTPEECMACILDGRLSIEGLVKMEKALNLAISIIDSDGEMVTKTFTST